MTHHLRSYRWIAAVGAALAVATARAQPRKSLAQRVDEAVVASCAYRVGDDGNATTIKDCGVVGNGSEFDVRIARDQAVVVRLDEQIQSVIPASDPDVHIEAAKSFAVYDLSSARLAKDWSSTIQTASYAVTLRFRVVGERGDSQVHIARADRADRDAEVERRVEAEKTKLEATYKEKFDALDQKAATLAREHNVEQLQRGYGTGDPGTRPTRHDFVVLRAEKVIRIGATRYLKISVENRDRPTLHIGDIRVWLERGDARDPVQAIWRCATTSLRAGKRTRCTLGLELDGVPAKRDRVRVRVVSRDGKRTVTLGGIDVR